MSGDGHDFRIDPEFQALLIPLTEEERRLLGESLIAEGCRDAVVVWEEEAILLDGHNRVELCRERGIPYEVRSISLPDRDAAKVWVIRNQLARRNLTAYARAELALVLEPLLAEQARQRMLAGKGPTDPGLNLGQGRTAAAIGKMAGISRGTAERAKVIHKEADEETKGRLRRGETSIHREYTRLRPKKRGGSKPATSAASEGKERPEEPKLILCGDQLRRAWDLIRALQERMKKECLYWEPFSLRQRVAELGIILKTPEEGN